MRTWPWGRIVDALIVLAVLGLCAVGALRWWDTDRSLVIKAQTLGPFVVIGLSLLLVLALLARRWRAVVPAVLACAVAWAMAGPAFFAHTATGEPQLRVLSLNMRWGLARAEQVMAAVRSHEADVLVLLEVNPKAIDRLDELGLVRLMPYRAGQARVDSVKGTMIVSRLELTDIAEDPGDLSAQYLREPEATVTVAGKPVRIKAIHPPAPDRFGEYWRWGMTTLTRWKDDQPADRPFLMAGDFNSDNGMPAFRALRAGMLDATREAGLGWVRTWPVEGRRLPPFVQLDHQLSRGLKVVSAGVTYVNGSDHALVWASYTL